jgi:hypothetical protein
MKAIAYEHLLRRIYNVARTDINGVNADIYRKMDRTYKNLESKFLYMPQAERLHEFHTSFAIVREHLYNAINFGLQKLINTATADDIEYLQQIIAVLGWKLFDKDQLDKMVETATRIFNNYHEELREF